VDKDYPAGTGIIEPLPKKAIDEAQNRPLWRMIYVWHYTLIVVHARNE